MTTLHFKIDPEHEVDYLDFFANELGLPDYIDVTDDLAGLKERTLIEGFGKYRSEWIKEIESDWNEFNASGMPRREDYKRREKDWRKVEKDYFQFVEKITGHQYKTDEMICYGSIFSLANYYTVKWDGNEILITIDDISHPTLTIAHELFHAQQISLLESQGYSVNDFDDDFFELGLLFAFDDAEFPIEINIENELKRRMDYLGENYRETILVLRNMWGSRKSYRDFTERYLKYRGKKI